MKHLPLYCDLWDGLFGQPYGGCCIFYTLWFCPTGSRRLNTSIVQLVGGQLLLIVYFPTDDGIKTILMKNWKGC